MTAVDAPQKRMPPEVKAQWLAALRSGEFKQGQRALRAERDGETRYCCLGVLCDLAVKNGVIPEPVQVDQFGYRRYSYGVHLAEAATTVLPSSVQKWAGVSSHGHRDGALTLASVNDNGVRFPEIADIIETEF